MLKRRLTIYAYFNGHYAGSAIQSAELVREVLARIIGKRRGTERFGSFRLHNFVPRQPGYGFTVKPISLDFTDPYCGPCGSYLQTQI